jgi:protein TonB
MSQGGFLEQRRASPGSLAIVIALHGAALTALLLAKGEQVAEWVKPLTVRNIPIEPPPPPEPQPQPQAKTQHVKTQVTQVQPKIVIKRPAETDFVRAPDLPVIFDPGPVGPVIQEPVPQPLPEPVPVPQPKADPVRREATMLASSALQPPYPPSEQRAENEGSVTIRILIGADGRVKSVEKVKAASDAFFRATESQALRHWRFKPATLDGKPVESSKVMTVHFRLLA